MLPNFHGRDEYIEHFKKLLDNNDPTEVMLITGIAGMGKSTLLAAFLSLAEEDGHNVRLFDCNVLDADATSVKESLENERLELVKSGQSGVLLIDHFEHIYQLEPLLRSTVFKPMIQQGIRLVIASREGFSSHWSDIVDSVAGITGLHDSPLPPLTNDATIAVLTDAGIPEELRQKFADAARGIPIILALKVSEYQSYYANQLEQNHSDSDSMMLLVDRIIEHASLEQELTLLVATLLPEVKPALLEQALDIEYQHADDLFQWLKRQAFARNTGSGGLTVHSVVRDMFEKELIPKHTGSRLPDLISRLGEALLKNVAKTHDSNEAMSSARAYVQIHTNVDFFKTWYQITGVEDIYGDSETDKSDHEAVIRIVKRHEGITSARYLDFWLDAQPEALYVIRKKPRDVTGFCLELRLDKVSADDRLTDPFVADAMDWLDEKYLALYGEKYLGQHPALFYRFCMDSESHHARRASRAMNYLRISTKAANPVEKIRTLMMLQPYENPYLSMHEINDMAAIQASLRKVQNKQQVIYANHFSESGMDWVISTCRRALGYETANRESNREMVRHAMDCFKSSNKRAELYQSRLLNYRCVREESEPLAAIEERINTLRTILKRLAADMDAPRLDAEARIQKNDQHTSSPTPSRVVILVLLAVAHYLDNKTWTAAMLEYNYDKTENRTSRDAREIGINHLADALYDLEFGIGLEDTNSDQ